MRSHSGTFRIVWILSVTVLLLACACSGDPTPKPRDEAAGSPDAGSSADGEEAVFEDGFEGGDSAEWDADAAGDEEEDRGAGEDGKDEG